MKTTIAIPSNRGINPSTFQCILELIANSGDKHDLQLISPEHGYSICENRNYIGVQALNNKSDYLLMIDDDMDFEPDLLDRMIANDKDICGVAFHPRCETEDMKTLDETHHANLKDNKLFESKAVGTGIILIRTEILNKIKRPWFKFEYHNTGMCKLGEDWFFSKVAKEAGFKVWLDPTIKVGHWGEKIY